MKSKTLGVVATLTIAFLILLISVLRCATPRLAYSPLVLSEKTTILEMKPTIDYQLAYPGKILPDNPLWYIKVVRDKLWYISTFNNDKKAELNLLFADKRLASSLELFLKNKPDLGFSTLTKAEKYLEKATIMAKNNQELYRKIKLASLKHKEVIENKILPITPEDLRPAVIKIKGQNN